MNKDNIIRSIAFYLYTNIYVSISFDHLESRIQGRENFIQRVLW